MNMNSMNSLQRVLAAIEHRVPDRLQITFF